MTVDAGILGKPFIAQIQSEPMLKDLKEEEQEDRNPDTQLLYFGFYAFADGNVICVFDTFIKDLGKESQPPRIYYYWDFRKRECGTMYNNSDLMQHKYVQITDKNLIDFYKQEVLATIEAEVTKLKLAQSKFDNKFGKMHGFLKE